MVSGSVLLFALLEEAVERLQVSCNCTLLCLHNWLALLLGARSLAELHIVLRSVQEDFATILVVHVARDDLRLLNIGQHAFLELRRRRLARHDDTVILSRGSWREQDVVLDRDDAVVA